MEDSLILKPKFVSPKTGTDLLIRFDIIFLTLQHHADNMMCHAHLGQTLPACLASQWHHQTQGMSTDLARWRQYVLLYVLMGN